MYIDNAYYQNVLKLKRIVLKTPLNSKGTNNVRPLCTDRVRNSKIILKSIKSL